jgi:hAT family C-terminal dimerisation region
MSVSRQIREAQQAAASNPDAPASRRPAIARAAPPPPAPKTQAQLDSWVRSAGKEKGEVDEEEPGSEIEQRKKKGRGASRSEYDSDADEQLGQGGSDDDEGNEGDEGIAAEEKEDEGHGDPDDDEPMLAPKAATKGRKTRRLGQVDALKTLLLRTKIPFDDADPLKFYRQNSLNCLTYAPLACRVAANLLGIPAGESHSERVFSWAGGFVTKLRNRLSDETLQELVVMYDFFRSNRMPWDEFKMSFANALATAAPK